MWTRLSSTINVLAVHVFKLKHTIENCVIVSFLKKKYKTLKRGFIRLLAKIVKFSEKIMNFINNYIFTYVSTRFLNNN